MVANEPKNDMERVFGVPRPTPPGQAGRQDADGLPYVTIFLEGHSFIWDGISSHVQVCNEAGEPIIATFPVPGGLLDHPAVPAARLSAAQLLYQFEVECKRWLDVHRGSEF